MATTAPVAPAKQTTPKQQFLDTFDMEHATTLRVLRAYPHDKLDLRPHPKCKTARELAWAFVSEQGMAEKALTTGLDFSKPMSAPKPPDSLQEIITTLEVSHKRVAELVRATPDDKLLDTVKFPVAPKTMGDVPRMNFLWMLLHDQIHHRGQFSVYLRMADAKVPSIYGPTADEPWM
jgi:uncharacterized damage-inducible protein DinB